MNREIAGVRFDSLLDALGDVERRRLLVALLEADCRGDQPVHIEQLARETDTDSLTVSMHHVHLPKLEALGLVQTGSDGQEVKTGPQFDEVEPLLRVLEEHRDELPADWV